MENYNKYLKLAIAMYDTRCDWIKGFYRVKKAIELLDETKMPDMFILAELHKYIINEDITDGRVFRDCKYNYNWIYDNLLDKNEKKIFKNYEFNSLIF